MAGPSTPPELRHATIWRRLPERSARGRGIHRRTRPLRLGQNLAPEGFISLSYKYAYIYICVYTWQRLKNIGLVTDWGGPVATSLGTESGRLSTNPPCDKPIEDCNTLHRCPRQRFCTEGPRQRYVTEGGSGDRDKPLFRVSATCEYVGLNINIGTEFECAELC